MYAHHRTAHDCIKPARMRLQRCSHVYRRGQDNAEIQLTLASEICVQAYTYRRIAFPLWAAAATQAGDTALYRHWRILPAPRARPRVSGGRVCDLRVSSLAFRAQAPKPPSLSALRAERHSLGEVVVTMDGSFRTCTRSVMIRIERASPSIRNVMRSALHSLLWQTRDIMGHTQARYRGPENIIIALVTLLKKLYLTP